MECGYRGVWRGKDGLKSFFYSCIVTFDKVQKYEQALICVIETYNHYTEGFF